MSKHYYASLLLTIPYLFALLARIAVRLGEWFTPLELFLPIALWFVDTPTVNVLGVDLEADFVLVLVLIAIVIGSFESEAEIWQYGYAFIFTATGVFLSFVVGYQWGFLHFLASLVSLTVVSTAGLILVGVTSTQSVSISTRYAGLTALIALTVGLLRELQWVLDVALAVVGIYVLYHSLWRLSERDGRFLGLDELLIYTVTQAGQSFEGIATSGLIYAGLFVNLSSLTVLFPFFIEIGLNQDVLADPSGAVLYLSAIFQILFFGLVIAHWTSFLTRVPYSVVYWQGGSKYNYNLENRAKNRPLLRGLMLILCGVVLTESIQASAETNPLAIVTWDYSSVAIFLILVSVLFVYSLASVPELRFIRKWIPGGRFLVSDRPSLELDSRTYFGAGVILTAIYAFVNGPTTVFVMAGFLVFYIVEVFFGKNARNTLLISAPFVLFLPVVVPLNEGTETHLWQTLATFWFAYLLLVVHSTRERLVRGPSKCL